MNNDANDETQLTLSGPFAAKDSSGQVRDISAIKIFDEGYGVIDVHVYLGHPMDGDPLFNDVVLIRHISAHLRQLGYAGPDLIVGDAGLQEEQVIVLEAPEAFNTFAERHGWKDLAAEFDDDLDEEGTSPIAAPSEQLNALMRKFQNK